MSSVAATASLFGPFSLGGSPAVGLAPPPVRFEPRLCTFAAVPEPADELEDERRLVEQAHAGDRAALGEILRIHGPRLYRSVLLPRLGSPALAEEALSMTYMKVVERFDKFTWQSVGVYPWLRVVGMRIALDLIRSRKREVLFEPSDLEREIDAAETGDQTADMFEKHDLAVARQRVEDALGKINQRYRRAIVLRVLEGRTREEAALGLEVSVSTFDVVLHRAMAALKKALALGSTES